MKSILAYCVAILASASLANGAPLADNLTVELSASEMASIYGSASVDSCGACVDSGTTCPAAPATPCHAGNVGLNCTTYWAQDCPKAGSAIKACGKMDNGDKKQKCQDYAQVGGASGAGATNQACGWVKTTKCKANATKTGCTCDCGNYTTSACGGQGCKQGTSL